MRATARGSLGTYENERSCDSMGTRQLLTLAVRGSKQWGEGATCHNSAAEVFKGVPLGHMSDNNEANSPLHL